MPIAQIDVRVEEVRPSGEARQRLGVQAVRVVAITSDRTRYTAWLYRIKKDGKETMKTGETWRNGLQFDEEGKIWIPQGVFSRMTRVGGAVMFQK